MAQPRLAPLWPRLQVPQVVWGQAQCREADGSGAGQGVAYSLAWGAVTLGTGEGVAAWVQRVPAPALILGPALLHSLPGTKPIASPLATAFSPPPAPFLADLPTEGGWCMHAYACTHSFPPTPNFLSPSAYAVGEAFHFPDTRSLIPGSPAGAAQYRGAWV